MVPVLVQDKETRSQILQLELLLGTEDRGCPLVTASVDEIILLGELVCLNWTAGAVLVLNREMSVNQHNQSILMPDLYWLRFLSLNLVQQRGKNSPGFGEFVTSDEVHLGANKHVEN